MGNPSGCLRGIIAGIWTILAGAFGNVLGTVLFITLAILIYINYDLDIGGPISGLFPTSTPISNENVLHDLIQPTTNRIIITRPQISDIPTIEFGQTVEWSNLGLFIDYPDGWNTDTENEYAPLLISHNDFAIYFYEPRDASDLEEAIEQLVDSEDNDAFDFDNIREAKVGRADALRIDWESPSYSGFSLTFEFDGDILLLDAGVFDDHLDSSEESILLAIIASIHFE